MFVQARFLLLEMTLQVGLVVKVHVDSSHVFHEVGLGISLLRRTLHQNRPRLGLILLTRALQMLLSIGILYHDSASVLIDVNVLAHLLHVLFVGANVSLQTSFVNNVVSRVHH